MVYCSLVEGAVFRSELTGIEDFVETFCSISPESEENNQKS